MNPLDKETLEQRIKSMEVYTDAEAEMGPGDLYMREIKQLITDVLDAVKPTVVDVLTLDGVNQAKGHALAVGEMEANQRKLGL